MNKFYAIITFEPTIEAATYEEARAKLDAMTPEQVRALCATVEPIVDEIEETDQ